MKLNQNTFKVNFYHIYGLRLCNISNKRYSVSSGYSKIEKRIENTTCSGEIVEEYRGVWTADETLSRVFDKISKISEQ